jgi:putative phosphoribosyl transferase
LYYRDKKEMMDLRIHEEVSIPAGKATLKGELLIPSKAAGIIVFSHGSGSSRFSSRNQQVAKYLNKKNLGTLLFDLLTEEEDKLYQTRFDIGLLTKRLAGATEWLEALPAAKNCRIGYFGASTGAASALKAAAVLSEISAVVSRGGRPDLAMDELHNVDAPTLLIVGGLDFDVLQLNKQAYEKLNGVKKLEVVEGATHLFEEPGKMEIVSELAGNWFEKYLQPAVTVK